MATNKQLQMWQGDFGKAYTDRNLADAHQRSTGFAKMLSGLPLRGVLEVGCNRGHNLAAIAEVLGTGVELAGVEPNPYALQIAQRIPGIRAVSGNAYALPFPDAGFDLVFTCGVLIHIPPSDLPRAIAEIYRVSRRYILAVEYFSPEDTAIDYRGHKDLLFKGDFKKYYQQQFPSLRLAATGEFADDEHGFAQSTWWLLSKPESV